jgi:acyl carrier protein
MSVETKVKQILKQNLEVPDETLVPTAALRSELGATSVDLVEVLADLENEFNIEISDEQAQEMRTIGDIVKFIESQAG